MRIVLVTPSTGTIPPERDGGTERVIHDLCDGLVELGHEVYQYAAHGSRARAVQLPYPFRQFPELEIGRFVHYSMPKGIDIINDHTFSSVLSQYSWDVPLVSSRHVPYLSQARNPVYVSETMLKTIGMGQGHYIHNGIATEHYPLGERKQDYLLFVGRIIPDKGAAQAIDVAEEADMNLVIAGPMDDEAYFKALIEPRLKRNPRISYAGPVGGQKRQSLLKHARCLLFPSQWQEPFGLAIIEAFACGTPVLALDRGAVREVLKGYPSFVCETIPEMARKLHSLDAWAAPSELRKYVEANFHRRKMVDEYLRLYRHCIEAPTPS
ncbi:glycosyltransferase [Cohnella fermenti]|nr:glycosyltransferase [Cohnella fermenti]